MAGPAADAGLESALVWAHSGLGLLSLALHVGALAWLLRPGPSPLGTYKWVLVAQSGLSLLLALLSALLQPRWARSAERVQSGVAGCSSRRTASCSWCWALRA